MNPNDINNFKKAMEVLNKAVEANEKFLLAPLAVKLTKAAEENPGDQTIYSMSSFLNSRAEKDMFISKAELNKVYAGFYTRSTMCDQYLEKELGKKAEIKENVMKRNANEGQYDYFKSADSLLTNALESVFDSSVPVKLYTKEASKAAEISCGKELNNFPVQPSKIETVAGNEEVILCKASYETPKGKSYVLVPVEIQSGKALLPTVFVSTAGFENLTRDNLGSHLVKSAGIAFQANVGAILEIIKTAKHGVKPDESLNEVERIVLKASLNKKANTENALFFELKSDAEEVKLEAPSEEIETFAQKLSSAKGIADFTFGKESVEAGRNMVRQAMESFGHKVQVAIGDVNKTQVVYAVSNGVTGLKVPVKFANSMPVPPSVALAGGSIESFDRAGVDKLFSENDYKSASLTSQFYGSKPNELIETIKLAMSERDLEKAENALNVLANSGDNKAYQFGMSVYLNEIGAKPVAKTATASVIHKCAMQLKTPNSVHIVCGHTNLPLNKVYQDEQGNCLPLYHKNVEHTNESGSFLDSKLYIG